MEVDVKREIVAVVTLAPETIAGAVPWRLSRDCSDNDDQGNVYGRASSSGSSFLMLIRSCAFSPMSSASEPATKIEE